jgi:hypothetical protein
MEGAMQSFQRACRRPTDANLTFANQPTCALQGKNRGALHNELQFQTEPSRRRRPSSAQASDTSSEASASSSVLAELEAELLGVGVINVKTPQLARASSSRLCRARRLAASLRERFDMSRLEVWQFEIDEARTPEAPRLYVAPRQCYALCERRLHLHLNGFSCRRLLLQSHGLETGRKKAAALL